MRTEGDFEIVDHDDMEWGKYIEDDSWIEELWEGFKPGKTIRIEWLGIPAPPLCTPLTRRKFTRLFEKSLKVFSLGSLRSVNPALVDRLLSEARAAREEAALWDQICAKVDTPAFRDFRRCVGTELKKMKKISLLVDDPALQIPPPLSPWLTPRVKAFSQLSKQTTEFLVSAKHHLDNLEKAKRLGRSEIQSYLLLLLRDRLREILKGTALDRKAQVVLPAFAYASGLVKKSARRQDTYQASIAMRVSRVANSRQKKMVFSVLMAAATTVGDFSVVRTRHLREGLDYAETAAQNDSNFLG